MQESRSAILIGVGSMGPNRALRSGFGRGQPCRIIVVPVLLTGHRTARDPAQPDRRGSGQWHCATTRVCGGSAAWSSPARHLRAGGAHTRRCLQCRWRRKPGCASTIGSAADSVDAPVFRCAGGAGHRRWACLPVHGRSRGAGPAVRDRQTHTDGVLRQVKGPRKQFRGVMRC